MENTNAPVIIVTEEKKRRKGMIWVAGGAAVAAAVLGGGTFALWSASDAFTGGTITAGDLNLVQTEDTTFWDVSADRLDATETLPGTDASQPGHAIVDSTWRIVPGDKVAAAFSANVTLEGDNLVARLALDGMSDNVLTNTGMTYTYEVYQDDVLLVSESDLPTGDDAALMYLSAATDGQDDGDDDAATLTGAIDGATAQTTVVPMTDGKITDEFTVVVYGEFDADTAERDQVTIADTLATMMLTLDQVRDTGAVFPAAP